MAICTSKAKCIFPLMSDKPLYAPYMTPPPLDMLDTSEPRPCWNGTSGGQASPHLSTLSSLGVLCANRTKLITILFIPHWPPSCHPHSYFQTALSQPGYRFTTLKWTWLIDGHGWPWPYEGSNSHPLLKNHRCGQSSQTFPPPCVQMVWTPWFPDIWQRSTVCICLH